MAKSLPFPALRPRSSSTYIKGAEIPEARSTGRLNFVRWRPVFVGPQYGTCFTSSIWRLEFSGGA